MSMAQDRLLKRYPQLVAEHLDNQDTIQLSVKMGVFAKYVYSDGSSLITCPWENQAALSTSPDCWCVDTHTTTCPEGKVPEVLGS